MATVARSVLAVCAASSLALATAMAGCSDAETDGTTTDGSVDGTVSGPDAGRDATPGTPSSDASTDADGTTPVPNDDGDAPPPFEFDAGPTFSRCRLPEAADGGDAGDAGLDAGDGGLDAGEVWASDFTTGPVADPTGDDDGNGDYKYPEDVNPPADAGAPGKGGMADLTSFSLAYSAASQELSFSVSVKNLTEHTRIGVVLYDQEHFPAADAGALPADKLEWAVSGNELRVPSWATGGLTMLLAKPGTSTFDLTARKEIAGLGFQPRPDNAIYFQSNTWLDCRGQPSSSRYDILELPVRAENDELSFRIPARLLKGQINLKSSKLYAIVYTYLLVDRTVTSQVEYGALEITEALGGLSESSADSWRDPDVFDLGFIGGAPQRTLLTPPPVPDGGFTADDGTKLVVVKDVGKGVLAIDTSGTL